MIRIGTASWTDPTLLQSGRFYPPAVKTPADRLAFYATQFPLVEVNASYYAIGNPMQAYRWAQNTPDNFRFHVKAFCLFTGHPTPLAALDADIQAALHAQHGESVNTRIFYNQVDPDIQDELWRRYLESIEPLRMAGRLDAVHFQFPPWIQPDARGIRLLKTTVERMAEHTLAIEWRHASWLTGAQRERTLAWQRAHNLVHTIIDSPQGVANSAPAVWETTHQDLALVRLHGRNVSAWNAKTAASSGRFNYEYTPAELAELAARIKAIAQRIEQTHVVLNTNYQDQGMRNAANLRAAIGALL